MLRLVLGLAVVVVAPAVWVKTLLPQRAPRAVLARCLLSPALAWVMLVAVAVPQKPSLAYKVRQVAAAGLLGWP